MVDRARGRGERERERRRGTADARVLPALVRERELAAKHAEAARVEPGRELVHEAVHGEDERVHVVRRRRQLEAARVARRRHERQARIGAAAVRAIERADERVAEAAREPVARQRLRRAEGA